MQILLLLFHQELIQEILKHRRTIRNYDPDYQIPKEHLDEILNAAQISPTSKDLQEVDFIVLRNKAKLDEIEKIILNEFPEEARKKFEERRTIYGVKNVVTCDAPVIILLIRNERKEKFVDVDGGIAAMSIMMAAQHFNLESMCLGIITRFPKVEEMLGLEKNSLILGVAIGKMKGKPILKEKVIKSKISYMD